MSTIPVRYFTTKSCASWIVNMWLLTLLLMTRFIHCYIEVHLKRGGIVRGTKMTSEEGRPFYAFRGIPYAEPPIKGLRFKPPVPKRPWPNYPFDATKDGPICTQRFNNAIIGQEDCLTINVYTPKLLKDLRKTKSNSAAVIVFIHGGSFMIYSGTSSMFPPGRLMDSNIVLVTINYRLDSLGFLGTEDASSPGNYGLLDQTLALQWVKKYIKTFGGNPRAVTILGFSSGAASVSYHLLSRLSKGLFQRAICMSGSSLCPWAFESKPLQWANYLASVIGCPTNSTASMVECFRRRPVQDLLKPVSFTTIPFPPTVDGHFLINQPTEVMKDREKINHVPIITGVVEEEGVQDVWDLIQRKWHMSENPSELADFVISYMTSGSPKLASMIKDRYLVMVNQSNKYEVARALIKAYSDGAFVMPHYTEVHFLSKAGLTVYAYSYDYHASYIHKKVGERTSITNGTSHGEDLYMLFDKKWYNGLGKLPLSTTDRKMVKVMTGFWSSFAKTGKPDPTSKFLSTWLPSSPEVLKIQHLNHRIVLQDEDLTRDDIFRFWTVDIAAALDDSKDIVGWMKIRNTAE